MGVVLRLSGTGTGAATLRLYLERFAPPGSEMPDALEQLLPVAEAVTRLRAISGREGPDVVT